VERFQVTGGVRLSGEVAVHGAKNSALKLMAAALLTEGRTALSAVPDILDVDIMGEVLRRLGCSVEHVPGTAANGPVSRGGSVIVDVPAQVGTEADYDLVRRMRASIAVLGPLVARRGEAKVALPGGDAIGSRGLDMHISGLQKLGATVESEHGFLIARADELRGATIWLDFPSVGATENLLMAAVLAKGNTVIDNAAREPEIVDLCAMLTSMGAQLSGVGSSTLEIQGADGLHPCPDVHETVPDRIVAGTFAVGAVMTQGDVAVRGGRVEHLEILLDKLVSAGATVEAQLDGFRVSCDRRPKAADVVTLPYPGFPTDLQPAMIALASVSDGVAMVTENVFEARFVFCDELTRLGADVRTDGHHAVIRGRTRLSGAPVRAPDIRAGAALVLAGLVAEGETDVLDVRHIDRGYVRFDEQLRHLGAKISRASLPNDPDS
jgi:UDP-N-acetylglucosamine 1-carboxyvinyltransferase